MLKQLLYRSFAIAVFLSVGLLVNAQITDGPNLAGTGTNAGGGNAGWNNTGNVTSDDDIYSIVNVKKNKASDILSATNFGFAIPANATITGVEVKVEHFAENTNMAFVSGSGLRLTTDGSSGSGNDKGSAAAWPTTGTVSTYGGSADLWGLTLSPAIVNNTSFGVVLQVENLDNNNTYNAYVDYVSISVTYTIPSPTITSLDITSGCPGDMLTITGTNLTGATSVTIGGTSAAIVGNTATQVKVTVGSGTTGAVVVTTSSGTTTEDPVFTVNSVPSAPGAITSDSPQCEGTGITFTKGSCGSGNTCYWVNSATGTETTNSLSTYTTSTSAGSYTVWVREYNGSCWGPAVSATGTVNVAPVVTAQPSNQSVVADAGTANFSVTATGATSFQWQESTDGGSSWSDVTDGGVYSGAATSTLTITNAGSTYTGYQYQCVVTNSCGSVNSDAATLNINAADYCTYSSTSSDYYIDYFSTTNASTNIANNNSGYSAGGYGDFTGQSVAQSQGMTFDFDVSFGSDATYTFGVGIYIDWNQDGDFDDANEDAFVSTGYQSSFTGTITVPASALTGDTRMRVACDYYNSAPEACGDISNGEAEDYTFHVDPGAPMAFSSMTTTQANTLDVSPGTVGAEIIGIEIETTGMSDPIDVTSFSLNTNGSNDATNDIVNARLYSTGTSSVFATTTQYGTAISGPSGVFTVSGSETLASGTNYFWLVYDVASSATLGNVVDAECSGATIDGNSESTTTSAPSGYRVISNTYLISNESDVSTCSGVFYDSGNSAGDYLNNELYTKTFYSATPGSALQFVFNSFVTESGYDYLTIYDGPDNTYPEIGTYDGTSSPGTITSSSESLTFEFDSDGSTVHAGWDADISCVPITVPNCVSINSPVNGEVDVCPGSVMLSWSPSGSGFSPSGYKLYVGTDVSATNIINGSDVGNTTDYTLTNLDGGTTFYWYVVPYNSAGTNSTCTSISSFVTLDIGITSTNSPISTCSNTYDLTASGGSGTVTWYNVPTGGSPIGTGSPFTASFNGDATFYVAEESGGTGSEYGGMPAAIETSGYLSSGSELGIVFDANDDFTLNAVDIYPVGTGTVDIALLNDAGTELASTGDVSIASGDLSVPTVSLGFNVSTGSNYKLILKSYSGITDLYRDFSAAFPFDSPSGALSVTGGWWDGSSTTNYYFYNLEITAGCVSARTPVYVTHTADPVSISADGPTTFLNGGSVQLTASSATAYTYSWSPSTGLNTDAGATVTASPSTTTTYTVTGDNGSCQYSEDITITVTYPCTGLGTGNFPIANLPFSETSTTCGNVDDITSSNATVCGSTSYYTGEDVVYSFEPNSGGLVTIDLTSSGTYPGLMLYEGCPMSGQGGTCIANRQSSAGNESICVSLQADLTYYLVIDSYDSPDCNNYSINISAPDPNGVPGDASCDAIPIAIGGIQAGDNACSSGIDEPSAPSCWTTGSINTVWYSFQAPASGSVKIKTEAGSLASTQMAVYQGDCSNLTLVTNACNQDAPGVCDGTTENSELELLSLTSGATYYIRIDGENDLIGTFDLYLIDGTDDWPTIPQQDCSSATLVCAQQTEVGDPGFVGAGSTCDYTTPYGCFSFGTQNNTVWYQIDISSDGTLLFDINPNLSTTDYDWTLVNVTGVADACDQIAAGTLSPVRCNFSGTSGTTGLDASATGTSEDASGPPFCDDLNVSAGDTYLLLIWNYSGNNTGFTLDMYSSPVIYNASSTLTWSGGYDTDWFNKRNWGGCAIPSCGVDAIIVNGPANQPVIGPNVDAAECANITIEAGASLTIEPGESLTVCENFNNSGSLNADPTSTILMNHASNSHEINGSLTGANALGNLSIDKAGGTVTFMQDIEIAGDLTTVNATSVINTDGHNVIIGGDFVPFSGTYTDIGTTGKLTFNGSTQQSYNPGGSLVLNDVTINNTAGGVLLNNTMEIGTTGMLALNQGIIETGTYRVIVNNTDATAVTAGNSGSYINTDLRRYLGSSGGYNFPVGTASAYRLLKLNNNGLAGVNYLDAEFLASFSNSGSLNTSQALDGSVIYQEVASEGIWRLNPDASPSGGTYDISLYFDDGQGYQTDGTPIGDGFTGLIDNQFAVLKRPSGSTSAADWVGEAAGTIPADGSPGRLVNDGFAKRSGITAFSEFGIGKDNTILPVELVRFSAYCHDKTVELHWETASEINNDYFTLLRSTDGETFNPFATVQGMGNSMQTHEYIYTDENPPAERMYYKLKQTDFDGKSSFSDVVFVSCAQDMGEFFISPNPFKEKLNIVFDEPTRQVYKLSISDMPGKTVIERMVPVNTVRYLLKDVSSLKPGTYYLRIISDSDVKTQKLIKM